MIKIMQISDTLRFGGIERIVKNFAVSLDRRDYAFSACALDTDGVFGDELRTLGFPVHVLGKAPGIDLRLCGKLYELLRRERVDIVHTHNFSPLLYVTPVARLAGVKVHVHTEHSRTIFPDAKRRMVAERVLSNFVDTITAVSNQVRNDMIKYEKIHPEKTQVIINGIETDVPSITQSREALLAHLGIKENALIVGVCCRLVEQKGVQYLIESIPDVLRSYPCAKFVIVGDGPLRAELEELSVRLGVGPSVVFTGFRTDVNDLLHVIDVYVLPSLFEGTPLGLLEAMRAGCPVIVTNVGSNDELVEDGMSGLIVPPKRPDLLSQAVIKMLSDSSTRLAMGRCAKQRMVREFSLNSMMQKYDVLYKDLMAQANYCGPKENIERSV